MKSSPKTKGTHATGVRAIFNYKHLFYKHFGTVGQEIQVSCFSCDSFIPYALQSLG